MMISTICAAALSAAIMAEATPQPDFRSVDVVDGPGAEVPLALTPATGGNHYTFYTRPNAAKWPNLYINKYDRDGVKQWTRYHEITRTPAGNGFDHIRATATNYLDALYFSYYSTLNGGTSEVIKIGSNNTLEWASPVKTYKCRGLSELFPLPGASDVVMTCGSGATRRAEATGNEVWLSTWYEQQTALRYHQAAIDNYKNVYILAHWGNPNASGSTAGLYLYKISPSGDLLWRKEWGYPKSTLPQPVAAFVSKDAGLIGVVNRHRSGQPDVVEIQKYSKAGALETTHELETGIFFRDNQPILAKLSRDNNIVRLAWDNRPSEHAVASEWVATTVQFEQKVDKFAKVAVHGKKPVAKPANKPSLSKAKKVLKKVPMVWRGKTLRTQKAVGADHDFLVDMDVDSNGRIYLLGVDSDNLTDYIRLTALSRQAGGALKTVRYRRPDRHARPTQMFVGDKMIYVLGQDDPQPGVSTGGDSDVLHLVFWKKRTLKGKRFQKAKK